MTDDKKILDGLDAVSGGSREDDTRIFEIYCKACGAVVERVPGYDLKARYGAIIRQNCSGCGARSYSFRVQGE